MKVVILCGGQGTRLREETEYRPKPLVSIGNRPIVWHIMNRYAAYGFNEFVLCLGYKGELIQDYFLNYRTATSDFTLRLDGKSTVQFHQPNLEKDWVITFANTGQTAMTGARVKRIERYIDTESFMLTYGDGLADIDLQALRSFHEGHEKIATVTGVRLGVGRFGELVLNGQEVVKFSEKPDHDEGYINGGFFVFKREVFRYLNDSDGCTLEQEPLRQLADNRQLVSYLHHGFWHCMDTYRDYQQLNEMWSLNQAPWNIVKSQPARKARRRITAAAQVS